VPDYAFCFLLYPLLRGVYLLRGPTAKPDLAKQTLRERRFFVCEKPNECINTDATYFWYQQSLCTKQILIIPILRAYAFMGGSVLYIKRGLVKCESHSHLSANARQSTPHFCKYTPAIHNARCTVLVGEWSEGTIGGPPLLGWPQYSPFYCSYNRGEDSM